MDKCAVIVAYYRPLLEFYFRGEENFAGGKFREIPFAVDINFAGGKFRAKSKFANIAKISSTRKIGVIQYSFCANIYHVSSRHVADDHPQMRKGRLWIL